MVGLRGLERNMAGPKTPGTSAARGSAKGEAEKEVGRAALAPTIDTCQLKNT